MFLTWYFYTQVKKLVLKDVSDITFNSNVIDLENYGEVNVKDSHFLMFNVYRNHIGLPRKKEYRNLNITGFSRYINISYIQSEINWYNKEVRKDISIPAKFCEC